MTFSKTTSNAFHPNEWLGEESSRTVASTTSSSRSWLVVATTGSSLGASTIAVCVESFLGEFAGVEVAVAAAFPLEFPDLVVDDGAVEADGAFRFRVPSPFFRPRMLAGMDPFM